VPYVTFFDTENSWLAFRLLHRDPTLDPMPPDNSIEDAEVALIIAWIGGAPVEDGDAADSSSGDPPDTGEDTTLSDAYAPVQAVWDEHCTTGCHMTLPPVLTSSVSYEELVNAPASSLLANEIDRVEPGSLEESFLWHRLNPTDYDLDEGDRMPPEGSDALTSDELATIEAWILAGAPE